MYVSFHSHSLCTYLFSKSKAGCDALIAEYRKRESKLHILVNNSGATWGAPFDNFPEKEGWDRVMDLNVKSIFYSNSFSFFYECFIECL